jgi:hypothetical protein
MMRELINTFMDPFYRGGAIPESLRRPIISTRKDKGSLLRPMCLMTGLK